MPKALFSDIYVYNAPEKVVQGSQILVMIILKAFSKDPLSFRFLFYKSLDLRYMRIMLPFRRHLLYTKKFVNRRP